MEFKLSIKELLFLSAALNIHDLYAFEYDNLGNQSSLSIDENEVETIKRELEKKGYIENINKNEIDIEEELYKVLSIWSNSEYSITNFDYNSEDLTPNGFLFLEGETMVKMEKIWGVYFLTSYIGKESINDCLIKMFRIKDFSETKNDYNISMSSAKLEKILKLYNSEKKEDLSRELNRLGIAIEEGINMLTKINDNSCYFISVEKSRENKGVLIKINTNDNENYIFKFKKNIISDKVVIIKEQSHEIINTLFVI